MLSVTAQRSITPAQDRFYEISAILMALVLVAGFSLQLAAGRSSFAAPPLVHAHAIVFFGWVVIYVAQTFLATRGNLALHRPLGWIAAGWTIAMVVLALVLMVMKVRTGTTPPIFQPQHFLIANPIAILTFAGLTAAAIVMRRRTDWHRRLHFCAMAALLGPGFGRLLPMPLLIPWGYQIAYLCGLLFPIAGMLLEQRRNGQVHRAWYWGLGALLLALLATEIIAISPLGRSIYDGVAAGSPGADIAPMEFGMRPPA